MLGLFVDGISKAFGLPSRADLSRIDAHTNTGSGQETEKEETRWLLEAGHYRRALRHGNKNKFDPVMIKSKVIEFREAYPDLSPLLLQAEDALIKNPKTYEKDCRLRDEICKRLSRKLGEAAIDLFPKAVLWRLVREKAMSPDKLAAYVIQQVEDLSGKLPSLDNKKRGCVNVVYGEKDCSECHGTPPPCSTCKGTGSQKRELRDLKLMREAQNSLSVRRYLRHALMLKAGITRSFGGAVYLYFGFMFGSPRDWNIIDEMIISIAGPCTVCHGSGKRCECTREVVFRIPRHAKTGMVITGEAPSGGKPLDKPVFARLGK